MTEIGVGIINPWDSGVSRETTCATQGDNTFCEWLERLEIPPGKTLHQVLAEEQTKRQQN